MEASNASHACALVLVDELVRCGVRDACLAPGSRSAALALALAERDEIRLHICIDERSAAFMAFGIARESTQPAIVLSTSGSATANFHPAIVEADASRIPMIVVTADRPPELRGTGANQTIDQVKMYGNAVRWFCELGVPEEREGAPPYWRSVACRAYAEAVGGPRGPVHLNVPMREPLVPEGDGYPFDLSGRPDGKRWTRVSRPRAIPPPEVMSSLAGKIASTERGLVVAGDGPVVPEVAAFAERAGYPLLAEPLSNLRYGAAAIGSYDAMLRSSWAQDRKPDIVVRVGRVAVSKSLARFLGPDVTQILIDPDGAWLDPARTTSWIIAADAAEVVSDLGNRGLDSDWAREWLEADAKTRVALDATLDADEEPSEPRVARDLVASVPDGSRLVVASSMPVRDLDSFMAPRTGITVFGNRGASGIDGFVSTTLGIASASDAPTFALAGDLSMLHDQNGLLGANDRGLDCTFVVLNNDGGGIFSFLPQARFPEHFERVFGTPHGINFERFAALYEVDYQRVEKAGELAAALDGGGVRLVEVRTDRVANVKIHRRAWSAVEAALT